MSRLKNSAILPTWVFTAALLLASSGFMQIRAQMIRVDSFHAIDQLFEHLNTATPGGVVSITRKGQPVYLKAFGMADLEHNAVNTIETVFEAGSVSKQFTAAAVLLLVKAGKISLTDDIRKYFPDFPDYGHVITVDHLLHHTSGLRDWGSVAAIGGWPRGTRKYTMAHVKEIIWRQKQLNFIPGSEYSYSNSNYSMLMFLVEKVSGKSFQQFTREYLFEPEGMKHTQWRDNYNTIVTGRAIAYEKDGNSFVQNMPFENTFGHGALLTTVTDLEKWNQRWKNNSLGADINLLQKEKGSLNNGKIISYARGVVVSSVNGGEAISHTGATAGYRALLTYYPETEISVVFLSNDANAPLGKLDALVKDLITGMKTDLIPLEKYPGLSIPVKSLEGKAGLYKHVRLGEVQELVLRHDSLAFKERGFTLAPLAENKFAKKGFVIEFPAGPERPGWMLIQNPGGDTATYIRVNPFAAGGKTLKEYTGKYRSEEADITVTLLLKDDKLQLLIQPDDYINLNPVFEDAFFDDNMNFCQVIRDKKRKITGFTITESRVRNLLFTKTE